MYYHALFKAQVFLPGDHSSDTTTHGLLWSDGSLEQQQVYIWIPAFENILGKDQVETLTPFLVIWPAVHS
jgi:hypothetical protein